MAGGGDDDWGVDGVGVHAGLIVVMHGYQGPVCDDTCDADGSVWVGASDQVFDCCGVEELDVWEGQHLGKEGGGEECLS